MGAADLALVLVDLVLDTARELVDAGDAGVSVLVQEEAGGACGTQVSVSADGGRGDVVGDAILDQFEGRTDRPGLSSVGGSPGLVDECSGAGGDTSFALV